MVAPFRVYTSLSSKLTGSSEQLYASASIWLIAVRVTLSSFSLIRFLFSSSRGFLPASLRGAHCVLYSLQCIDRYCIKSVAMGTFGSAQWWIDTLARPEGLKEGFNKLVSNATLMPWRRPASGRNEWRAYLATVNRIDVGPSILSRREEKGKSRAIVEDEHDHDSNDGEVEGWAETSEPRRRPWTRGEPADAELWMIDVSYAQGITTCDGYKEWETRIDRSKDPYADPRLRIKDDILTRRTYLNRARNLEGEVNGARSPGFDIYGLGQS